MFSELAQGVNSLVGAADTLFSGTPGSIVPTNQVVDTNSITNSSSSIEEMLKRILTQSQTSNQNTSGTQSTQNLSEEQEAQLNEVLGQLTSQLGDNSSYVNQANESMEAAISRVLSSGIGKVAEAGTNAGAYNSTTQGKLASRLAADAATSGATVRNQVLEMGQNAQNSIVDSISKLLTNAAQGSGTVTTDQNTNTAATSTTRDNSTTSSTSNTVSETETDQETNTEYDEIGKQQSLASSLEDAVRKNPLGIVSGLF